MPKVSFQLTYAATVEWQTWNSTYTFRVTCRSSLDAKIRLQVAVHECVSA